MAFTAPNEALSAYLDGELTEAEVATLEEALSRDAALRAELESIQRAVTLLRNHGAVPAPSGFHQRVLEAVAAEVPRQTWWQWLRRPFGIPFEGYAVTIAAVAVLLFSFPMASVSPTSAPEANPGMASPPMRTTGVDEEAPADDKDDNQNAEVSPEVPKASPPVTKEPNTQPVGLAEAPPNEAAAPSATSKKAVSETEGEDANPDEVILRNPGFSYTVYTENPDAIIALIRTAEQYSGTLTGLDNQPLQDIEIPSAGERVVVAHVPFTAVGSFQRALDKLGTVQRVKNDKLIKGDTVTIRVSVQMAGDAASSQKDAKPAPSSSSKKLMDSMDLKKK
jgi:hypothetical protein